MGTPRGHPWRWGHGDAVGGHMGTLRGGHGDTGPTSARGDARPVPTGGDLGRGQGGTLWGHCGDSSHPCPQAPPHTLCPLPVSPRPVSPRPVSPPPALRPPLWGQGHATMGTRQGTRLPLVSGDTGSPKVSPKKMSPECPRSPLCCVPPGGRAPPVTSATKLGTGPPCHPQSPQKQGPPPVSPRPSLTCHPPAPAATAAGPGPPAGPPALGTRDRVTLAARRVTATRGG